MKCNKNKENKTLDNERCGNVDTLYISIFIYLFIHHVAARDRYELVIRDAELVRFPVKKLNFRPQYGICVIPAS